MGHQLVPTNKKIVTLPGPYQPPMKLRPTMNKADRGHQPLQVFVSGWYRRLGLTHILHKLAKDGKFRWRDTTQQFYWEQSERFASEWLYLVYTTVSRTNMTNHIPGSNPENQLCLHKSKDDSKPKSCPTLG